MLYYSKTFSYQIYEVIKKIVLIYFIIDFDPYEL